MTNQTNIPEIYCVGGGIRDTLLNLPVRDLDYVVVGATHEDMIANGFKPIEATSFPVFHDPDGNEYALARTERKTGNGYHGFETDFNPTVTLEADLFRRDLTINSMAVHIDDWEEFKETKNVELVIDPYGGIQDLKNGIFCHTSNAFSEDPVRVLRVARFCARYDFHPVLKTFELMRQLVESGELDSLTPERVYSEFEKATMEDTPIAFFQLLGEIGAGEVLFPEWFTEDRLPINVVESLERSVLLSGDFLDRVIILTAGLKTKSVQTMFKRLKAPNDVTNILQMSCTLFNAVLDHTIDLDIDNDVFKILNDANAWKHTEQFYKVMHVFSIFDNDFLRNSAFILLKAFKAGNVAKFDMLSSKQKATLKGKEISNAIGELRLKLINDMMYI